MHPSHFAQADRRFIARPAALQSRLQRTMQPDRRDDRIMQQNFDQFFDLGLASTPAGVTPVHYHETPIPRCLQAIVAPPEPMVKCPGCSQEVRRFSDLMKHLEKSCTGQERLYRCETCHSETLSKEYLGKSDKSPPRHKWKDEYTFLPKHYGCPCCGEWLKDFKSFMQHVLDQGHNKRRAYRVDGPGQVNRLRGLLMQPRVKSLVEPYSPEHQPLHTWLATLHWDVDTAREAADQLQHRYIDAEEGLPETGIPTESLPAYINELLAKSRIQASAELPVDGLASTLTSAAPMLASSRPLQLPATAVLGSTTPRSHKRVISIASYELPEGVMRAHHGPYKRMEQQPPLPVTPITLQLQTTSLDILPSLDSSPQTPSPVGELWMQPVFFSNLDLQPGVDVHGEIEIGYDFDGIDELFSGQAF